MIARSVLEMITSLMPAPSRALSAGMVSGKGCQEPHALAQLVAVVLVPAMAVLPAHCDRLSVSTSR